MGKAEARRRMTRRGEGIFDVSCGGTSESCGGGETENLGLKSQVDGVGKVREAMLTVSSALATRLSGRSITACRRQTVSGCGTNE